MPLAFFSYARKSSQGESHQTESILDQEKILLELEQTQNLAVVGRFKEAKSAKEPGIRPVFRQMLDGIKGDRANAILCWHLNRLSRNPLESGELQWLLQSGKIRCIKTPEREYHPEDHALLMAVESSMANQYVRDLKTVVERGVRAKAERGIYPFKPKAGYLIEPLTRELIVDPIRFPLLRKAWELLLSGDGNVEAVREALDSWGYRTVRTKSGGNQPICRSSLYRLFADRFYTGYFTYDGLERLGSHQPMVSEEEFKKARRLIDGPLKAVTEKHYHPYAGLMRCGVCGCQITAENKLKRYQTTGHTRLYHYYRCTCRKGCPRRYYTEAHIEEQIKTKLEGCRLDPYFVDWALSALKREEADEVKLCQTVDTTTTTTEQSINRRIDSLFLLRENGEIGKEEFVERKAKHQQELNSLGQVQRRVAAKKERDRETLKNLLVFSRDGYDRFTKDDPHAKRQVARAFSDRYVLTLGKLDIRAHPALELIRTFEPLESGSPSKKDGSFETVHPAWRAVWELIRTAVDLEERAFDGLGHEGSTAEPRKRQPKSAEY